MKIKARPIVIDDMEWIGKQAKEASELREKQLERDGHVYDPITKEVVERDDA